MALRYSFWSRHLRLAESIGTTSGRRRNLETRRSPRKPWQPEEEVFSFKVVLIAMGKTRMEVRMPRAFGSSKLVAPIWPSSSRAGSRMRCHPSRKNTTCKTPPPSWLTSRRFTNRGPGREPLAASGRPPTRLGIEAVCQDGRRINAESKRWEFRSYHPKNGRGRRTTTRTRENWDMTLNTYALCLARQTARRAKIVYPGLIPPRE